MIHSKKDFSSNVHGRLNYVYGGAGHEHKVDHVRPIGGTCIAEPELTYHPDGTIAAIDFSAIQAEMELAASCHTGKGEQLYAHYIISLPESESLNDEQWSDVLEDYMTQMGYDPDLTKYSAVVHGDTKYQHMHIVACRVQLERGGPLISDNADYERGMISMRRLEAKYGLQAVANPEDNFGKHFTKDEMKGYCSRQSVERKDPAAIMRTRIDKVWRTSKPTTMRALVVELKRVGIDTKCRPGTDGLASGISYKLDDCETWISGSKIKSTRLTFHALQRKEGISYLASRDDAFLALNGRLPNLTKFLKPAAAEPVRKEETLKQKRKRVALKEAPMKLDPVEMMCGYRVYIPLNNLHISAAARNGWEMPLYNSTGNKRATYTSWDFIFDMAVNFSKSKRDRALEAKMAELLRFVEEIIKLIFGTFPSESVVITYGAEAEQVYRINKVKEREAKCVQDKKAKEIADEIKKEEAWIDGAKLQEIPDSRYDWDADNSMALVPRQFQQRWR
ncbi:relaxase/mobilization nuclease domain-containing protein [Allohahella marinimesophila]|uniref:MobA/VirD2-like nuclease domain-containing protein n=1 Tax=Allohahella marinimesophila TaxID=1054972 RepID=A0ABP7NU84_9GAMM